MAYKWPNKDPDEILDFSVDWSRFLNGASIQSYSWYVEDASGVKTLIAPGAVVNGIQNVSQTANGDVVTINLGLGTLNTEYKFYSRITDNTGGIAERSIKLRIKEE